MADFNHYEKLIYKRGYRIGKDGHAFNPKGKEVKGKLKNGYLVFAVKNTEQKRIDVRFSRLQAYQKYGDKLYQSGIVVRHLNNNKLDNSWDNISIGTYHDNMMDNPPENRLKYAFNAALSSNKYDANFVEEIRQKHKNGWSYNRIKAHYGLAKSTISYIINHDYKIHKSQV